MPAVARKSFSAWRLLKKSAAFWLVSDNVGALNSTPVTTRLIPENHDHLNELRQYIPKKI
jgi:hypothetical protein